MLKACKTSIFFLRFHLSNYVRREVSRKYQQMSRSCPKILPFLHKDGSISYYVFDNLKIWGKWYYIFKGLQAETSENNLFASAIKDISFLPVNLKWLCEFGCHHALTANMKNLMIIAAHTKTSREVGFAHFSHSTTMISHRLLNEH
jgi:hypothetical protein